MIRFIIIFSAILGGISVQAKSEPLNLREKIGQMLILGFEGHRLTKSSDVINAIQNENIGGVILFDYNFKTKTFDKNIHSPEQVKTLNAFLQSETTISNQTHHRPHLPLLISVDYEGGYVNRLKPTYGFPDTLSAKDFSKLSMTQANIEALAMANTLQKEGFNLNFAPVLDVDVNPNNPVIGKLGRSYSADPLQVIESSYLLAKALKSKKIACAYKHFPGHGSSTGDSHLGFVDVTDTWKEYELQPYQALSEHMDHKDMVMTAHIVNKQLDPTGLPATLSKSILTGMLREQLGFRGVVITDDMQMKAISEHYGLEEALVLAINAGADMFIFGNQLVDEPVSAKQLIDLIEKNVKNGNITERQISEAVERIIHLKHAL